MSGFEHDATVRDFFHGRPESEMVVVYRLARAHRSPESGGPTIDLALLYDDAIDAVRRGDLLAEAVTSLDVILGTPGVRCIDLSSATVNIAHAAINQGRLLWARSPEEQVAFESRVRTEFQRGIYEVSSSARNRGT